MKKVIFSGGGTAGHVNPALAVASYFHQADPDWNIVFSGGTGGIEETLVARAGYPIITFPLSGLSRSRSWSGFKKNISAVTAAYSAVRKAKEILTGEKPDIVIGTGGYACYPMVAAAQSLGVPTAMIEVNATPGVALRRLSKKADCVFVAFEETQSFFPKAKRIVYTGSPVRPEIYSMRDNRPDPEFQNGLPTVLCFWGSVGAMYMNKKMEEFISLLAADRSFNLIHAAGRSNFTWMPGELEDKGVDIDQLENVELREYIYDMGRIMNACDLVICRAGASTLAEICACGKPSLIVPSPYVADNHQEKNARALERAGAARVALENEVDGSDLFEIVKEMLGDPEKLTSMGERARALCREDASDRIYQAVIEIIGEKRMA